MSQTLSRSVWLSILPVPSLWPDILQKIKAAGFNAISVYTHMAQINPSRGVVDFSGHRALQPLFDAAKASGLWIILRPGKPSWIYTRPRYINAETSAGGIAHWITTEIAGQPRSNDTDYRAAWQDYIAGIIKVTAPNQISSGGPVIAIQVDNEFSQAPAFHAAYFAELEEVYHNSPIDVPLTYNDPGMGSSFINGTGAVDLYGFDEYPQRYDCTHQTWNPAPTNYYSYHMQVNPANPQFIPEFQSGAGDSWGLTSPGYDGCRLLTGPDFLSVFNQALWASNAKMINFYMFYGGTSWGAIPYPGIYTSYDYGATITESRQLTTKFDEMKRQGLFLRSTPDFYKTDWIADTNSGISVSNNPAAYVTELRNPDTQSGYFIVRQANSSSLETITLKLNVTTSAGALQIPLQSPDITIGGRQSKVINTDYKFGSASKALYSTAQVLFAGIIDGRDILFLHGDTNQTHEIALALTGNPSKLKASPFVELSTKVPGVPRDTTVITFGPGITDLITVWDSDTQLILFADSNTAATFWAPVIPGNAANPFKAYWGIGTNESVLVGGPSLVRDASISGTTLALSGDLETSVQIRVVAPRKIKTITWNGARVALDPSSAVASTGGLSGQLKLRTPLSDIKIPQLTEWKFQDSLPEIQKDFDDDSWTIANHTTTNIPYPPYYNDGRILYGCDYGFCENVVLWRGHFKATGQEKSLNLTVNGGQNFAASVWLNDVFLNSYTVSSAAEFNQTFEFPDGALLPRKDNVITVIQDNMGLDENGYNPNDVLKSPRGIRGFQLDNGGQFEVWKVQGKVGGYKNFPDKTRGVLNEGGLFGERSGWHLPSFPISTWATRALSQGLPDGAGVGFFVTTFDLNIQGVDAMISFTFTEPLGQAYRAYLFVNGWMMGKRVGNLGPQAKFPVHEGILNYHGQNTVAVALWSLTNQPISPELELHLDSVVKGGVGNVVTNNPVWNPLGRIY
uniref:beta-galactosidase n=1 Tax=Psilocybe cubensis TaxID=181762 RepID=A0A8H7XXB1_PSICU